MTREEFETILDGTVTTTEYDLIEKVYMDHPSCKTKEDTAALWKIGGIPLFNSMLTDAIKVREAKFRANSARIDFENVLDELSVPRTLSAARALAAAK